MKTLDLLKAQGKIGLWFSPRTKSLLDQSGNGNVFTANTATGATFINTKLGTYFKNTASAYFSAPNAASNQLNGKGTILVFGEFQRQGGTEVLVAKRGATCNYQLYVDTGLIGMYDGVTGSIATNVIGAKMVGCRLTNAGAKVDFFKDGLLLGASSATHTFPSNTEPVSINQFGGAYNRNGIYDLIITQEVLTDEQISDIYNEFLAERGYGDPKCTNFRCSAPKETEPSCVLDLPMYLTNANNQLVDVSGYGKNFAPLRGPISVNGGYNGGKDTCGGRAVYSRATADADFWAGTYSFEAIVKFNSSTGSTQCLFSAEAAQYCGITSTLFHSFQKAGAVQQTTSGVATLPLKKELMLHYVLNVAGSDVTVSLYIDGVLDNAVTYPGVGFYPYNSVQVLGCFNSAGSLPVDATIYSVKYFKGKAFTAAEIKQRYNNFAKRPVYTVDESALLPTLTAVTAGKIGNTSFSTTTGSWAVSEDTTSPYKRWLKCVSNGIVGIKSTKAYGTWVFDVYHADNSATDIMFIASDMAARNGATQSAYTLNLIPSERVQLEKNTPGTSTDLAYTAPFYFAAETAYRFVITRKYNGQFSVYIKGGAFTNWTLVSVAGGGGANPTTDNAITTSKYIVLNFAAGDKFSNLQILEGVIDPTVSGIPE